MGNNIYYLIEKISNLLAGDKTLFLIDDIIADETLDKRHQPLLKLAILGRHRRQYQETSENALRLVSKRQNRPEYHSQRE